MIASMKHAKATTMKTTVANALTEAVRFHHIAVVHALLAFASAHAHASGGGGSGDSGVLSTVLRTEADDGKGLAMTPAHLAAYHGSVQMLRALLPYYRSGLSLSGSVLDFQNSAGGALLHFACQHDQLALARFLLAGAGASEAPRGPRRHQRNTRSAR